jgi:shikimate kinase
VTTSHDALEIDWASRPIAVAGFMGVGKSSIGRVLAGMIDRPFFDADSVIVERLGMPIATLFRIGAEERFRTTEAAVIAELIAHEPPAVIALGGGALGNASTLAILKARTLLVHIHLPWASLEPLLPKLRRGRPLLEGSTNEEIRAIYTSREALYAECHVTVQLRREGVKRSASMLLDALGPFGVHAVAHADEGAPLP